MISPKKHLIGGELVSGRSTTAIDVYDPATGQVIDEVNAASSRDVDAAVAAARHAFEQGQWQRRSVDDRADVLWRLAEGIVDHLDELAELEVRDNGMPLVLAKAMIGSAVGNLKYYAGMVSKVHGIAADLSDSGQELHVYTRTEPVGVVAAITPWNAPFATFISKVAPALAAGCSIVSKPAEQTPLTATRFGELLHEWKLLPEGQVNIINGLGPVAGDALANHPDVDKVTFTGSTAVGRKLIQASAGNFKRLTLELGGKSPLFIFDDADLEQAIPAAAQAIFLNSGQVCLAGSRLYVQRSVYDQVIEGVAKIGATLQLGSGLNPQTQMGPLVSEQHMRRVLNYIESGVSQGAELIGGGSRRGEKGYFVEPTVFSNPARTDLKIVREEIFGPVIVAMPFDTLEEVAPLANDTEYGLGAGVYTRDISTAHRVAKSIRAGNVWINCYGLINPAIPFGGFKRSGWGRESGFEGIAAFLETKAVYARL
jgi:phenylacetaldehyde dehydrogenase